MSLNVEFIGLACFRMWGDEGSQVVITDPYTPFDIGMPENFVTDADIIIASSLTDTAHFNRRLVKGEPEVIDALEIAEGRSVEIAGVPIQAVAVTEDPALADSAKDCAMYGFRLGDVDVVHMGDAGYVPETRALEVFRGRCDLLLALAGVLFTPPLEELDRMIDVLAPRWVIPMHYFLPPMIYAFRPVEDFLTHRRHDPVYRPRKTTVKLPLVAPDFDPPMIVVLEAAGLEE